MEEENPILSRANSEETELKHIAADDKDFQNGQVATVCELPAGKKYHLFVSCSSLDNRSIEPILETLKDLYNIKCVDPADFIAGKPVLQNINDLMVESMKMLIVITPNYLESNFCNYEKCLAFFIHAGERRHCLIPLLLEPCDDLPVELKQLTYIDAETERDIPARIVDALKNNDSPNCLVPNSIPQHVWRLLADDIPKPSRKQNGHPLFFFHAVKLTHMNLGNQWQFKSLTETEVENMEKDNIKMGDFYETLIADLNSQRLMKHYGALVGRPQLGLMFLLSIIVGISSTVILYCGVVLISGEITGVLSAFFVLFFLMIFLLIGAVLLGRKFMFLLFVKVFHVCIWKHMKSYYKVGKFLIFYNEDNTNTPSLELKRYDTEPCKNHLVVVLSNKYKHRPSEEIETMADNLIEWIIVQERKRIYTWCHLPSTVIKRHNTYLGKKCLCELIEDILPIAVENNDTPPIEI